MGNNCIDISEYRAHLEGKGYCVGCSHEWEAVAPVGVVELECPECGTMKGVFKEPVGYPPGDIMYECKCGCGVFTVGRIGFYCYLCGTMQDIG